MAIGMGDPVTPATAPPLGVGPLAAQPTPVGIAAALEVGALDVEGTRAKNLAILYVLIFFSYLLPLSARVLGQYNTTILWF